MTDALVSTEWVAERLDEPGTRVIEVSISRLEAYAQGHLPGAVAIDWQSELIEREDESSGLVIGPERFATLARRLGLRPEETLVFYGDAGGRHAARALWTFEYYRHSGPLHLMDGGREAWEREGRRAGKLKFSESITEYRDQDGELVITARSVGVQTERVVEQ